MSSIGKGPGKSFDRAPSTRNPNKISNLPSLENINQRFAENIQEIENLFRIECSDQNIIQDIHRSQLVFLYSSLDHYMHEIIAYGLVMSFFGYWKLPYYNLPKVDLMKIKELCDYEPKSSACVKTVKQIIENAMQYETMMKLEIILSSLEKIGIDRRLLAKIEDDQRFDDGLKVALKRRNLIVHQADRKTPASIRNTIDRESVEGDLELFKNLQQKIHSIVKIQDEEEKS